MIHLRREPEPDALRSARRRGLARAVLGRRRGESPALVGYDAPGVRDTLHRAQHAKCAYCERGIGKASQPIEHFRPKAGADRGDPFAGRHDLDPDRYWWLAWSWSNLLLSCSTCNSASFKAMWFPLEPGSPLIAVPDGVLPDHHLCFEVGIERAMLVDPTGDDPLDHIHWQPRDKDHPLAAWRAHHRTERGRFTIQILGLDGRNVDRVGEHIRDNVHAPWISRVLDAIAIDDRDLTNVTWQQAVRHLFAPYQQFQAATHDALDHFVPQSVRHRFGLALPRPGGPTHSRSRTAAEAVPSFWKLLPDDVVLEILADLRPVPDLIRIVCQRRPATVAQLTSALGLTKATVQRHCKQLVASGLLTTDASRAYRAA